MGERVTDDLSGSPEPQDRSELEQGAELREARNQVKRAATRARFYLVRLGKWRRELGEPTSADLSGAGTLVKVGDRKGILTAAHNIKLKFPGSRHAHKGQSMEAIIAKHGGPSVVWTDVDLTHAVVEGGSYSGGEPEDMGPDIAWIPLAEEKASFFTRYGKVFFDLREDGFPEVSITGGSSPDSLDRVSVGHLVTGFSTEREKSVSRGSRPFLVEVAQDVFFPDREWLIDDWDYQESVLDRVGEDDVEVLFDEQVPVATREAIPSRVDRVAGLSGGALWRFGVNNDDRYFDLAGVVWYQRWRNPDGVLSIVNHGQASIRRVVAP